MTEPSTPQKAPVGGEGGSTSPAVVTSVTRATHDPSSSSSTSSLLLPAPSSSDTEGKGKNHTTLLVAGFLGGFLQAGM